MEEGLTAADWELIGRFFGAALAVGLGGIGAAVGMGMAAASANENIMRQPERQSHLLRTMLIGQAVGSSPSIFALVVALIILFRPQASPDLLGGSIVAALIASGLAIGLGCLGSGLGCGYPAEKACDGAARNPRRTTEVTQAMLIGQAMAQSPGIFALVVSMLLLFRPYIGTDLAVIGMVFGAGIAVGASALGSGIGTGIVSGGAFDGMTRWPMSHGITLRAMLVGQGVCQTPAIFGLLIALIILYGMGDLTNDWVTLAKLLGAGIAMGFGGIGPGIGSGLTGSHGCEATAFRPRYDTLILRTMLIGQAVAQSTAMYALIIALLLLYVN